MRVALFHNIPSPYRLPLFRELANIYDLKVFFLQENEIGRNWNNDRGSFTFDSEFVTNISFLFKNKNFVYNTNYFNKIRLFDPDVVILPDNNPNLLTTLFVSIWCKANRIPIVLWTEGYSYSNILGKGIIFKLASIYTRMMRRLIYPLITCSVAYGKRSSQLLSSLNIQKSKFFSGSQVYPPELIEPFWSPPDFDLRFDNNIFLFIGYFRDQWDRKGLFPLMEAFKQVNDEGHPCRLIIIGDGPFIDRYRDKAKGYPILFTGALEKEKKYAWFKKAKALILPSYQEPWGLVVNEAMYFSIPPIVSRESMVSEIIVDGENGYLVNAGDIDGIKNKILQVLNADRKNYEMIGNAARNKIEGFDLGYAVNCFSDAINFSMREPST